jgi:hypothetical protein
LNIFFVFLPKIRIKNLTGFPIDRVGIKFSFENKWGDNRLVKVIPDEKAGRVSYPIRFKKNRYDIIAFDIWNDEYQINNVILRWNMLIEISDHNQIFKTIKNYYEE